MKKIILLASFVGASLLANAQFKLGVQAGALLPLAKDYKDLIGTGIGGGFAAKYFFIDNFAGTASVGYTSFGKKKVESAGGSYSEYQLSFVPVTLGAEYYFSDEGFKPFVGAELGYFNFSFKTTSFTKGSPGTTYYGVTYGKTDDKTTTTTTSKAYIGFAPIVGFLYGVSDKLDIGANVKYQYIASEGTAFTGLGINAGIFYTFGK